MIQRRTFLTRVLATSLLANGKLWGAEMPAVTDPRATSGDRIEPQWDQGLEITVGPRKADIVGSTNLAIQAAVDLAARWKNATVRILPGKYVFRNAVVLPSGIRIIGSGNESILEKAPSTKTKLVANSDWYDQEITLHEADNFRIGDGVFLHTKNPHNNGISIAKRTLIARQGNRFKLDQALRENFWLSGEPTAATLFPLFTAENSADIVIENLTFDGNKANNENLNGNYGGCIFLQDCQRIVMRGLTVRNYNGDGISWQICHDVVVENCHSHDNTDLGLHPGSGSQRPLIRNNRIENATIGLFFCRGVRYGLAENNHISGCRDGISIGHRDTDNLIRNNHVERSGNVGIHFRHDSRERDFDPHRNRVEGNQLVDNGPANGIAIDVQGTTQGVQLLQNRLVETRSPQSRIAIRISAETRDIVLQDNTMQGFAQDIVDLRATSG